MCVWDNSALVCVVYPSWLIEVIIRHDGFVCVNDIVDLFVLLSIDSIDVRCGVDVFDVIVWWRYRWINDIMLCVILLLLWLFCELKFLFWMCDMWIVLWNI